MFANSEQAFMWEKALFFKDKKNADKLLKETDPKKAKDIGRIIKNFNKYKWSKASYDIMYDVVEAKFTQNPALKTTLLSTVGKTLVEASPYDDIWCIKMDENKALNVPESEWKGLNLLGKVLTELRDDLLVNQTK